MIHYEIKEEIAKIGNNKELNLISWNGADPKLDLRNWIISNGEKISGKGITLTKEEAITLLEALKNYLEA